MKISKLENQQHIWTRYLNPRNKRIQLQACATCGILRGGTPESSKCVNTTKLVANMLERKGWVVANHKNIGQRSAA